MRIKQSNINQYNRTGSTPAFRGNDMFDFIDKEEIAEISKIMDEHLRTAEPKTIAFEIKNFAKWTKIPYIDEAMDILNTLKAENLPEKAGQVAELVIREIKKNPTLCEMTKELKKQLKSFIQK